MTFLSAKKLAKKRLMAVGSGVSGVPRFSRIMPVCCVEFEFSNGYSRVVA